MGKLLRVLVFIFFILSVAALVLGWMLFAKREILKGRTQKLERTIIQLGAIVEDEPPQADGQADYPARDLSPVTSEIIDTPELSTFWDDYSNALEQADQPTMRLQDDQFQLMQYYRIDPATEKIARDRMGRKETTGPGTMQEVLDELLRKAEAQYNRLNRTREQLRDVRMELVDTIVELNQTKNRLRASLNEIENLKAEIARLNNEIRNLNQQIEQLQDEKRQLQDQLAEQRDQIAQLQGQQVENQATIERLEKTNADLERQLGEVTRGGGGGIGVTPQIEDVGGLIQPGVKGDIVAVNQEYQFVVFELTDQFMEELMNEKFESGIPAIELMVKRPGPEGAFVTKVKLMSLKSDEKLAIADILTDWQQMPLQKGDVVFR